MDAILHIACDVLRRSDIDAAADCVSEDVDALGLHPGVITCYQTGIYDLITCAGLGMPRMRP